MVSWVIELNDCDICVIQDGVEIDRGPGIAVLQARQLVTGADAAAQQYSNPRAVYNRYWQQLNEASLIGATRQVRHHADLAYHHLAAIITRCGRPDQLIFSVPAHYGRDELALLLGICSALNLPVSGFVDNNIAAAAGSCAQGRFQILDLFLHHATLVTTEVGESVVRSDVVKLEHAGLARIEKACTALISDAFLEQSRFDPLHEAASEQLLCSQLTAWLRKAVNSPEIDMALDYHGTHFSAHIQSRELERVTAMVLAPILENLDQTACIVLSPTLAGLPGCRAMFRGAQTFAEHASSKGIAEHLAAVNDPNHNIVFATTLPTAGTSSIAVDGEQNRSVATATPVASHVVYRGFAFAIIEQPLLLGPNQAPRLTSGTGDEPTIALLAGTPTLYSASANVEVNGETVVGQRALAIGDAIIVAGTQPPFTVICVQ